MKLNDLDKKVYATKALQEQYNMNFNVSKLSKIETKNMLNKVRSLANETRNTSTSQSTSPSYMKLVFMEQALVQHYNQLSTRPSPRIVVENEEVDKSQVVLAAQDLVDSIQKMLEDVGQMQVKELPALVDSIESEIGVNESQTYNEQVSAQLDSLSAVLKEAFSQLKAARDTITGQGPASFEDNGQSMDLDASFGDEMNPDLGDEMNSDSSDEMDSKQDLLPAPDEELDVTSSVGRPKR